jgi:hypothetical protein
MFLVIALGMGVPLSAMNMWPDGNSQGAKCFYEFSNNTQNEHDLDLNIEFMMSSDCCVDSKPRKSTFKYTGEGCSASNNNQGSDKWYCQSSGGGLNLNATVYIKASSSEDGSGDVYFAGIVALNGTFTIDAATTGDDKLPSNTYFNIYASQGGALLQRLKIHTSCSTPIVMGDQFGSLIWEAIEFEDGSTCAPPVPDEVCPTPIINVPSGQKCAGTPLVFSAPDLGYPCLTYVWDFGPTANPPVAVGLGPHTVVFASAGTVNVKLSIDNGCSNDNGSGSGGSGSGSSGSAGSGGSGSGSGGSGSGGSGSGGSGSGGSGSGGSGGSGSNSSSGQGVICSGHNGNDGSGGSGGSGSGGSGSTGSGGSGSTGSGGSGSSGSGGSGSGGSGSGGSGSGSNGDSPCGGVNGSGSNGSGGSGSGGSGSGGSGSGGSGGSGSAGSGDCFCIECRETTTVTITIENCNPCANPAAPGTACNDGNPSTVNDVIQNDGCTCAGNTPVNCTVTGGTCTGCDALMSVTFLTGNSCVEVTSCKALSNVVVRTQNGAEVKFDNLSAFSQSFCSPDGSPIIRVWVKSGCFQSGDGSGYGRRFDKPTNCSPVDPCANQGGDTDGDGVCNNQDCQPNNPAFPATPGSPCNDGNPNTNNDVVSSNGCACAGTPVSTCNVTVNGCVIKIAGLNATSSAKIFNSNWQIIFDCNPWTGNACGSNISFTVPSNGTYWVQACGSTTSYTVSNCGNNPCANQGGDSDGDGVCNNQDCQPNNPAFPATPGTPCNDGNPNTTNDVVTANGCGCAGTPVSVCDNITNGGTIGFGANCAASIQHCPTTGPAPTIGNCASPSGGTGVMETVWLKSTTSCSVPTTTAAQIAAGLDPHWTMIPGQTGLTLNPGTVTQNTCFLRCTRRAGCSVFIESNIISLTIAPNCGGTSNTPNCANIGIAAQPGKIVVSGLSAPVTSIQVFNSAWQTLVNCFGNCPSPTATYNVPAGTYYVKVKFYTANYQFICEVNQTVNVANALIGDLNEQFDFMANKQEAFTNLVWMHNGGYHVERYILERSANGIDFEVIGGLDSKGSDAKELYEDFDLEPLTGDNYYRVKLLDINGITYYSDVQKVHFAEVIDFTIFPNPASDFAKLNLEELIGQENASITIFNNLGLQVKHIELDEVWSKYYQMDIRDMHEGHYTVWLNVPGKRPIAKKMVVGKI